MQQFMFCMPTEIHFGRGAEMKAGEKLKEKGASRVLIVYGGGSVKRSGLLERVERSLSENGIEWEEFGGVQPNPYTRGSTGSCTYCPYASVCHLDLCKHEARTLRATSAKEFWARLAQKEAQHG